MYSEKFYLNREQLAKKSAEKIADIICKSFLPDKIIDFGCANGIWLNSFLERGVKEVYGIDGPWLNKNLLRIPESSFFLHDLINPLPKDIFEKVDLAICLEVAEHLPAERAPSFIKELTDAADIVLFSAAVINQGGTGHLNEQRQSYWKILFSENGFDCLDIIRPKIWDDPDVNIVYKQNCLMYVKTGKSHSFTSEKKALPQILDIIHPDLYEKRIQQIRVENNLLYRIKKMVKNIANG